jgi:cytidylate kinase
MAMTEREKCEYAAWLDAEVNERVDRFLLARDGTTYRHATLTPSEKNGHPKDSYERIKRDYPNLFGQADAS